MNKNYRFIPNTPIGEDKFEGQSQEKIANVLVDILNDDNFQIIGIDGSWGTGKSNLVEIVNKKLPLHKFFIYDVWGHQEDEQRRAILMELTESLSRESIIKNNSNWDNKLKVLLSKKKTTTTINQPYLSIGFILSLMAIIYVPLVNVFSDKGEYKDFEHDRWRILLVGFPIVLIVFVLIWKLINQWIVQKLKFKDAGVLAFQQTFQVYNNKQEKETKIETISEDEPSVQEFRNWMKEIDSDLGDKKLVLVFDNFDRLPKKHIVSIWSSLHVFFSEEKYQNIKVIVPFDRAHIKNAFKDMDGSIGEYSNDYINKTFDLVYRVSPPILSSWKSFFKENWKKAFVDFNEREYLKVEQAYEIIKESITPREIITFINEVVSLKLLQDVISERYIAIFVLNKDYILENPLSAILDLKYLKGLEPFYEDDEDFEKNITALAFQIDPENALEVVYRKRLKDSLLNKDVKVFNELAKTSVFERILQSVLTEIDDLRNPVEVLSQIQVDSAISDVTLNHTWNYLYQRLKNSDNKDGKINNHHKILLEKIEAKNRSNWLQKIIEDLSYKNDDIKYFINSIDELDLFVRERSLGLDVFPTLPDRKIDIGGFITLIQEKEKKYPDYKLHCNIQELDEYLKSLQVEDLDKALFVEHLNESSQLEKFKKQLIDLGTHHTGDLINFALILRLLQYVSVNHLPTFLQDAQLYSYLGSASPDTEFYADLLAIKIKLGIENHPSYSSVYDNALNNIDEVIATRLVSKIGYFMTVDEFLDQTIVFQKEKLKTVAQTYIESNIEKTLNDKKNILDKFQTICQLNDIEPESLFQLIDQFDITELTFDYVATLTDYVFENAMKSSTEIAKYLLSILHKEFDNYTLEKWSELFVNLENRELELLDKTDYSNWSGFASEAFKTRLIGMLDTGAIEYPEKLDILLRRFESSGKDLTNTFKDVRDDLISQRNINENLFSYLFSWMLKYSSLNDKSEDVLRTIVIPSLLDSDSCLTILTSEHISIKALKDSSDKSAFSDLKDGIIARKDNPKIQELSKLLSVKLPKEEKLDNAESEN
jgi:hypothetical protein